MSSTALVFGGRGALGDACAERFVREGWTTTRTSRVPTSPGDLRVDLTRLDALDGLDPLDAVVWAQGTNAQDSVLDIDVGAFDEVLQANTTFVVATLARLLERGLLAPNARLVVISSIWQELARTHKLSYSVSKAALGGLVRSAAADLAELGVVVNALLPGIIDSPMTRQNLSAEQLTAAAAATGFGRLTTLDELVEAVWFFATVNRGINGQCIPVDLGFSTTRRI